VRNDSAESIGRLSSRHWPAPGDAVLISLRHPGGKGEHNTMSPNNPWSRLERVGQEIPAGWLTSSAGEHRQAVMGWRRRSWPPVAFGTSLQRWR